MRRMVQFAVRFPNAAMVSALPTPLSCNHMDAIVALKTPQVRQFECWSSDVCGRKLRPPPKSNRSTAAVHQREEVPVCALLKGGDFCPGADAIQVMAMTIPKGQEFVWMAIPSVGHMPAAGEDEKEAARVFYVAATQRLVMGVGGGGVLKQRWGSQQPRQCKRQENR